MNYDELEEQYFILTQRNKELEQKNNALELQLIELETQVVVQQTIIRSAEERAKSFSEMYTNETFKVTNLNVILDETKKKLDNAINEVDVQKARVKDLKESMIFSTFDDPYRVQEAANRPDAYLPRYSIHLPMERIDAPSRNTDIVLHAVDKMGFADDMDYQTYKPALHLYADLDGTIVRYSQRSMMSSDPQDFAVMCEQMTDRLKYAIARHYYKQNGYSMI